VIHVHSLSKIYRVHRRPPGLVASLRSLVHRKYEDVHALREVSFVIAPGERVGFLGPNGAGKTTALKILSGLLYPSHGEVKVGGFVPQGRHPDFLRLITLVMGQKQQLLWDLPPAETFAMNRALFDLPKREADAVENELVDLLQIRPLLGKPCRQLSLGERMKCELVAALLHRPKVLFLDEPTIGLDVSMQAQLRDFIRHHNESTGATILLTSHYMADVAALCPRVIVIDKGRLIYDGELKALARRLRPEKRITLHFSAVPAPGSLERLGNCVAHSDTSATLSVPAGQVTDAVRAALEALPIADISVEDPPLEEVMREFLGATRPGGEAGAGERGSGP
jgi:ABC-2 type transport system ATP-binding protein